MFSILVFKKRKTVKIHPLGSTSSSPNIFNSFSSFFLIRTFRYPELGTMKNEKKTGVRNGFWTKNSCSLFGMACRKIEKKKILNRNDKWYLIKMKKVASCEEESSCFYSSRFCAAQVMSQVECSSMMKIQIMYQHENKSISRYEIHWWCMMVVWWWCAALLRRTFHWIFLLHSFFFIAFADICCTWKIKRKVQHKKIRYLFQQFSTHLLNGHTRIWRKKYISTIFHCCIFFSLLFVFQSLFCWIVSVGATESSWKHSIHSAFVSIVQLWWHNQRKILLFVSLISRNDGRKYCQPRYYVIISTVSGQCDCFISSLKGSTLNTNAIVRGGWKRE